VDIGRLRCARDIVSSNLLGTKRIAIRDLSGFQAGHKPASPLCRSTVGECVGHNVTLSSPLQSIVSDGRGCLQGSFYITGLDELPLCLGAVCPDTGKTIGLQFHSDLQRIRLSLVHPALRFLHLRQ
jgi:hypothetical protein